MQDSAHMWHPFRKTGLPNPSMDRRRSRPRNGWLRRHGALANPAGSCPGESRNSGSREYHEGEAGV